MMLTGVMGTESTGAGRPVWVDLQWKRCREAARGGGRRRSRGRQERGACPELGLGPEAWEGGHGGEEDGDWCGR